MARRIATAGGGPRICVVTFPLSSQAIYYLLFDLVGVLKPLCSEVVVVSGRIPADDPSQADVRLVDIRDKMPTTMTGPGCLADVALLLRNLLIQVKLSWATLRVAGDVDIAIFFIGVPFLLLPMVIAKMRGVKVVWY